MASRRPWVKGVKILDYKLIRKNNLGDKYLKYLFDNKHLQINVSNYNIISNNINILKYLCQTKNFELPNVFVYHVCANRS